MKAKLETKFYLKSKINGRYLSHLFEDKHNKQFTETEIHEHRCYYYLTKEVADNLASLMRAVVIAVNN